MMLPHDTLTAYTRALQTLYATGKTTEHSYREAFRELMAAVQDGLMVINEPRRIEVGAPDFIIQRDDVPLGFVEAKDIDVDLDKLDRRSKKQLEDYRAALPNLIHTNYLHFRWYVGGELREDFSLGALKGGKIEVARERFDDVAGMLARFIEQVSPTISSPAELARRMAAMTRQIATLINNSLPDSEALKSQMVAFEQTLIPNLKPDEFADMYAQTLAYGLFAARVRYVDKPAESFTLQNAFWNLPDTNPFLRRFFQEIVPDLDERVRWQAETLASLLAHAKMDVILKDFGKRTRTEDPVVHFYETFLREYDPDKREQRGVYYTPEPVVSYIVRSVDHLLRERFGRDGLADPQTLILDPATGTGTFLYFVIQQIYEQMAGQRGLWNTYVRDKLLPRLFGFELLMAPYAVAHMKLGIQLQETGYTFSGGRLGIYLTNTLEETLKQNPLPMAEFITKEADAALRIKKQEPIMVVLGNPPYSGHSANKGAWIVEKVRDYYKVDGQPLGEHNPKYLLDDYVKFIRFGQWRISKTGSGILAFVTNHGYLDNPTFRGMRQQLMTAFDDIYILNLHGNSRKKEKTPDGGKDENVFDIQQGVAIGIFVKNMNPTPQPPPQRIGEGEKTATVHYADLWGKRESKYAALLAEDMSVTEWETLTPSAPFYLFTPQDLDLRGEYEQAWKVTDIHPVNSTGVKTHRDQFVIDFDSATLEKRIGEFRNLDLSDTTIRQRYGLEDTRDWKLVQRRKSLSQVDHWQKYLEPHLYRPFDLRTIYNHSDVIELPRSDVMHHMSTSENLGLCTNRQVNNMFKHVFCTVATINDCTVSLATRERTYLFPLYLYPDPNDKQLFEVEGDWPPGKDGRTPNLSKKFVEAMKAALNLTFKTDGAGDLETDFGPEDVFHYAYAVFHSPTYRERYAEFLKIDFPRLPITSDPALFRALCQKGAALVDLHLLRSKLVNQFITTYPESGDDTIAAGYPKYESLTPQPPPHSRQGEGEEGGRVYINKRQYFGGITPELWEFHVGGYQVLEKWLKDRRGRALTYDDIQHYQRVVVALANTITLMEEIDDLIPAWPIQ